MTGRVASCHQYVVVGAVVAALPAALVRSPSGFRAAQHGTLAAELADVAVRAVMAQRGRERADGLALVVPLLDAPPPGTSSSALAAELVVGAANLVVAHAAVWCTGYDPTVLSRCQSAAHRLAIAVTCRQWSKSAVAAVRRAADWQRWPDSDVLALISGMEDHAPLLTPPADSAVAGFAPRWTVVGLRPYQSVLWRAAGSPHVGAASCSTTSAPPQRWCSTHA